MHFDPDDTCLEWGDPASNRISEGLTLLTRPTGFIISSKRILKSTE